MSITFMLAAAIAFTGPMRASLKSQQPSTTGGRAATVDLDALENDPNKFIGKTVTVEGEVDRVLGPNLFTIDERNWVDLEREMPVVVPEPLAAVVHTDAPVRVTGTVQKVPVAQIERRGGILSDPKIRAEIETRPALVATEVTMRGPGATAVNLLVRPEAPVGTAGGGQPITDLNQVATASDTSLVGRRVNLSDARVSDTGARGFWITTPGGERIFVMPAAKSAAKTGQTATIQGVILEMPEGLRVELKTPGEPVYIYAERVMPR